MDEEEEPSYNKHVPERGIGYVAASRFRSSEHLYYYKGIRTTDWLPVGYQPGEVLQRSALSDFEDDEHHPSKQEEENSESGDDCDRLTSEEYALVKSDLGDDSDSDEECISNEREMYTGPLVCSSDDMGALFKD
jgi:hypothetical protein